MNKILRSLALVSALLVGGVSAFGQVNSLTQTTLSSAVGLTDAFVNVVSATGISVGTQLYFVAPGNQLGEAAIVQSVSTLRIGVSRGRGGMAGAFPSGSTVLIGAPNYFYGYSPNGACTTASVFVSPWVNTKNGSQWLCSSITLSWVAGFMNDAAPVATTAAVASAAGAIVPSGPLFHVTGTAAITGFTIPVGFASGTFTIIPDAIFTTTTAGNIALASTAVVNKLLTFTWDSTNSKFVPSY